MISLHFEWWICEVLVRRLSSVRPLCFTFTRLRCSGIGPLVPRRCDLHPACVEGLRYGLGRSLLAPELLQAGAVGLHGAIRATAARSIEANKCFVTQVRRLGRAGFVFVSGGFRAHPVSACAGKRWRGSDFRRHGYKDPEVGFFGLELFFLFQDETPIGTLPCDDSALAFLLRIPTSRWH